MRGKLENRSHKRSLALIFAISWQSWCNGNSIQIQSIIATQKRNALHSLSMQACDAPLESTRLRVAYQHAESASRHRMVPESLTIHVQVSIFKWTFSKLHLFNCTLYLYCDTIFPECLTAMHKSELQCPQMQVFRSMTPENEISY